MLLFSAQEDGEVDFTDGVQVTPFNMKEELEEGHFDSSGMYIFDKNKVTNLINTVFIHIHKLLSRLCLN